MGLKSFSAFGGLLFICIGLVKTQEDSLRSALNAVDRRQKDLTDESVGDYGYSLDGPEDLAFLPVSEYRPEFELDKNPALERVLLDYLEDGTYFDNTNRDRDDAKKRISSSFRERLEEDKEKQLEEQIQNSPHNFDYDDELLTVDDYKKILRDLWDKYQNYPSSYNYPKVNSINDYKRSYYPKFGLDGIGLRKRDKYYETSSLNDPFYPNNYNLRNDYNYLNRVEENDGIGDNNYYNWNTNKYFKERKFNRPSNMYSYPTMKRFPVTKRSSNILNVHKSEITHEHKRSTPKKENQIKTDPKVVKDLSHIFGTFASTEKPITKETEKSSNKSTGNTKKHSIIDTKDKNEKLNKKVATSKEEFTTLINDKPLQIKKKSINWSDYFGLDRRKKSDDKLDNEWLMEHYHKAVSMATKRNVEYPLQSFKNHDQTIKKESISQAKPNEHDKKNKSTPEELKISEMDVKLKNTEDAIIDDALKYTGAHEGSTDSKEIQEVKDKIISRLAAAYSLEKMRRALGEYKLNIAKERERLKQQRQNNEDYEFLQEKRVSVPRKQAIDEEREKIPESDNNIKCTQGDKDCEEQNYKTPSDILELNSFEECPKVQRACNEVASILGPYGRVFEAACNMHQMCLLCNNNSWFVPTRQCNVLFLTKAMELCDGKEECQKEAQRSIRYLLNVNRNLRLEPLGDCELACPDRR